MAKRLTPVRETHFTQQPRYQAEKTITVHLPNETEYFLEVISKSLPGDLPQALHEAIMLRFHCGARDVTQVKNALALYDQLRALKREGYIVTAHQPDGSGRRPLPIPGPDR